MKGSGEHCFNCNWWERLESDPEVGDFGSCHHPISEAQHIAFMSESAPFGLEMEGARAACIYFTIKRKGVNNGR